MNFNVPSSARPDDLSSPTRSDISQFQDLHNNIEHRIFRNRLHNDEADSRINELKSFLISDFTWLIISIVMRLTTIGFNLHMAYEYYVTNNFYYFYLTLSCILVPTLITSLLYIYMFYQDCKMKKYRSTYKFWKICIFVVILPYFIRYGQSLLYAIKSKLAENRNDKIKQKKYHDLMIIEESDIALIRLFDCYLETAPQKILQIFIMLTVDLGAAINLFQIISISMCCINMGYCMVTYNKYNRLAQLDKNNLTALNQILLTFWHFLIATSRILCIIMLSLISVYWVLIGIASHIFILGTFVFFAAKPYFCTEFSVLNYIFCLICGIIYVFIYFPTKEGPTKSYYVAYYFYCISENFLILILFIYFNINLAMFNTDNHDMFVSLCVLSQLLYFLGIGVMLVYYWKFHPKYINK